MLFGKLFTYLGFIVCYHFCKKTLGSRIRRQVGQDELMMVYEFWDQLVKDRQSMSNENFDIDQFHNHSEIVSYLCSLEEKISDFAQSYPIGLSSEQRPLQLLKLGYRNVSQKKYSLLIDAGFHAREWGAVSSALFLIDQIVKMTVSNSTEINTVLRIADIYILPVANPDGYEYTWHNSTRRLWRKTRSPQNHSCFGVDPNRNFPFHWSPLIDGQPGDPCQSRYPGPGPLSEPETLAVANYLAFLRNSSVSLSYVTLHAFARYWAVPYSYHRNTYPSNYDDMFNVATEAVQEIRARTDAQNFVVTHSGNWYPAGGTSDDFAIGVLGLPYAYTIEVAPNAADSYRGFLLPSSRIIPTGKEVFVGIRSLWRQIFLNITAPRYVG